MVCCCAVRCSNRSQDVHKMYSIPMEGKNTERRKIWLHRISRWDFNPRRAYLCETSKQPSLSDSVAEDVDKDRDFVDTQISYGMNAHLPSCSDCVELKTTHDMGRGLFATKDIKIGDVIIIEEPFVAVLKEQYLYSFCHNCCKRCNFLIPCQHCTVAMFCSVECRKSSWELYHSVECTVLPSLLQNKLYDRAAYPLRTIIVASKKFKSLDDFYKTVKSWGGNDVQKDLKKCSDYFQVHNLVTRIADLHQMLIIYLGGAFVTLLLERKTNFFATAEKSKNIKGVPTGKLKVFITSLFVKHALCQPSGILTVDLMRNSMGIGIRLTSIGYATYPTRSLLNHSCDPNVICYTDFDNYTVVRALRIIKKGEQIFESYGPQHSHHDLQERRAWLLQGHGFTCQCVACQEDWPLMENLAKVMVRFKCKSCGSKLPEKISRILKCTRCHTVNDTHRLFGGILAGIRTMERVTPHVAKNGLHTMNILYFMKNTMSYVVRPSHALLYCEEYLTDYYLERVALKNVD